MREDPSLPSTDGPAVGMLCVAEMPWGCVIATQALVRRTC